MFVKLREYAVDLHIHTVLSPCGGLDMGAPDIAERAVASGLHCIAITDHNSCGNVRAVMKAAEGMPLLVLPGLEVQTEEDIHVVTVFPHIQRAEEFEVWLRKGFLPIANDPESFGEQLFIDSENQILGEEEILLVHGVGYSIDQVLHQVHEQEGFAILAHVDRASFSYVAVLGNVPEDLPVDGIELSRKLSPGEAERWRKELPKRTIVRSSDSHSLESLKRKNCSRMLLEKPSFEEILLALKEKEGRKVFWPWGDTERESSQ
ncbi:MAG TPA: PHP domain-containing protein [Synergistaceae bacterium]|nr:PHP domain-containing protein [Synergistaceae bacterium]